MLGVLEWVYLLVFTFEMGAKMIAYGLLTPGAGYLRDAWCQLDFAVVSLAWLPILFPSMVTLTLTLTLALTLTLTLTSATSTISSLCSRACRADDKYVVSKKVRGPT